MASKETTMRSDADLQAIQTSVAFKNISDAVEQYRRQFGLAFLALIAFSAIHVGLVVIANLYTMQTRVSSGLLTDAADSTQAVATASSTQTYDLSYIMSNMDEQAQLTSLRNMKSASFVDTTDVYRSYTVTGFQLGGWKRSELKLYTSVGHVLEYVRGKGLRVFSESGSTANNNTRRSLLAGKSPSSPTGMPSSPTTFAPTTAPTYMGWSKYNELLTDLIGHTPPQSSDLIKSTDMDDISSSRTDEWDDLAKKATVVGRRDHAFKSFYDKSDAAKSSKITTEMGNLKKFVKHFTDNAQDLVKKNYDNDEWGSATQQGDWEALVKSALTDNKKGAGYSSADVNTIWSNMKHNSEVGAKQWAIETQKFLDNGFDGDSAETIYNDMIKAAKESENILTDDDTTVGMLYASALSQGIVDNLHGSASQWDSIANFQSDSYAATQAAYNAQGSWNAAYIAGSADAMTAVVSSVDYAIEAFSAFKATGFIGATKSFASVGNVGTNKYGCTDSSVADHEALNSDISKVAFDKCNADKHMVGGYFFSQTLGTYEAFLVYATYDYCEVVKAQSSSNALKTMTKDKNYYVYFLHGWGGTADTLLEAEPVISHVFDQGLSNQFITIAPNDAASPFGGKHFYMNGDNNGYHMDMIVFELPSFIEANMGLDSWAKGLFGFSMGGFGTISIAMTYSSEFQAAAAFNTPLDADMCYSTNTCHLQCGINPVMCEMVWTSFESALSPYVVVKSGKRLDTQGYYDPVAYGNAAIAAEAGSSVAQCAQFRSTNEVDHEGMVVASASGWFRNDNGFQNGGYGNLGACATGLGCFQQYSPSIESISWNTGTFWLNPIYFIVSSGGYAASHNPMTDARNTNTPAEVAPFNDILEQMPLIRLRRNQGMLTDTGIESWLLVACDTNDEHGLHDVTANFMTLLVSTMSSENTYLSGGIYHDKWGTGGHTMSMRDFAKAFQFFSDVFDTAVSNTPSGTTDPTWVTSPICAWWFRYDEATIASQFGYMYVGASSPAAGENHYFPTSRRATLAPYMTCNLGGSDSIGALTYPSGWDEAKWSEKAYTPEVMDDAQKTAYVEACGGTVGSGSTFTITAMPSGFDKSEDILTFI